MMHSPENPAADFPQSSVGKESHAPYPDYKDSGIEWLGEIPAHWGVTAAKKQFSIQLGKMLQKSPTRRGDTEVPYLKARHVQWFSVDASSLPTMWIGERESEKYCVQEGDLVVCEGGEGGRCGLVQKVPDNCIIQNALHRVREAKNGESRVEYLQYVISAVSSAKWFDATNSKATIAHFTKDKFNELSIPVPSHAEQCSIATFLDRETEKIDTLIEKQERLIDLLKEKRAALISHAVTKGLNPDAPLKDSGIEWLGEIPAHWGVTAAKKQFSIQLGKMLQKSPTRRGDTEVPYLKARHVQWFSVDASSLPTMWIGERESEKYCVQEGDLVVCEGGEGGRCGLVQKVPDNCIIQNALHRVREAKNGESRVEYLQYVISAVSSAKWFDATNSKATIAHFTKDKFNELSIPVPSHAEQCSIATFLDRETEKIDTLISKIHQAIELQKESRSTLITAAVTGKMDVRQESVSTP